MVMDREVWVENILGDVDGGWDLFVGGRGVFTLVGLFCVTCRSIEPSQRRLDMPNSRRLYSRSSKATGRPERFRTRRGGSRSSSRTVKSRVKKFIALCKMSKDEFNKRLIRKYPTPEERRTLYGDMVASITSEKYFLKNYDKMKTSQKLAAIQQFLKLIFGDRYNKALGFGVLYKILGAVAGAGAGKGLQYVSTNNNINNSVTNNAPIIGTSVTALAGLYTGINSGNKATRKQWNKMMKKTGLDKL